MHGILASLLLLGAIAAALCAQPSSVNNIQIGGVSVNTSTSGMDEAGSSAHVPNKGFVTDTVVGPRDPRIKPPKGLPSTGGGILITSNSKVDNGIETNKVATKLEAFKKPAPKPALAGLPQINIPKPPQIKWTG